jgi:hypothetical protein
MSEADVAEFFRKNREEWERTAPKRRRKPEGSLKKQILAWAEKDPRVCLWNNAVGLMTTPDGQRKYQMGLPGSADITGVLRGGRRIEIETKSKVGKPKTNQLHFQRLVERYGALYVLARTLEDVQKAIDAATAPR